MRRHRTHAAIAVASLLSAAAGAALADDAPAAPAKTKFDELLDSAGLTVSGYIAASYQASNGYPTASTNPNSFPFFPHQFDVYHNSFQVDQAGLQVAYQPKEGFGALVDVIAGEDARILHEAEDGKDNTVDIRQAFLQYATGPLTVMAGKFVTLAGAEVINPTLNTQVSRSYLFTESEPLTHTGIRAAYAAASTTVGTRRPPTSARRPASSALLTLQPASCSASP
jgi:Putative beta-barrel porin-2, OmpL-like. bbp2